MTTEQLELWADNPLLRQIRDELMAKQMRIDALGNPSSRGVLLDDLAKSPRRVRSASVGFEQIDGALSPLAFQVLGEFPAEA
jgi:hypothetical protein